MVTISTRRGISVEDLRGHLIRIFAPFRPQKILLFGSWARGSQDESSDVDVLVVYESPKRYMDKLRELYMAWDLPMAVDILTLTPEEYERLRGEREFIRQLDSDGRVILEAS